MNESGSSDRKVTEPFKLSKGEESTFLCGNDKEAQESKLSGVKCGILKAS